MVRARDLDVTREIAQKEAATEVGAVAAAAMIVVVTTVADTTAAVDTTAEEEVELLVWGKLRSATTPKVPPYAL